jgi:predicted nucleic acid-binding protein
MLPHEFIRVVSVNQGVLIDTCAWIDFLRGTPGALSDQVALAIEQDRAVMCGVVVAELLQGVKAGKEQRSLEFLLANVACAATLEADWHSAGLLLGALRQKGLKIPLTDALIAAVARRCNLPVLTVDQHFKHLPVALLKVLDL